MIIINPDFKFIEQGPGIQGIYKQIEIAGRTCYKSEDKMTDDSAEGFVNRMIKSGHGAMLEHGTVYLKAEDKYTMHSIYDFEFEGNDLDKYRDNKYSTYYHDGSTLYVTTNLRVLVENGWMQDLELYFCEPTPHHEKRITVRFTCDRGVSHEFVRHKLLCVA